MFTFGHAEHTGAMAGLFGRQFEIRSIPTLVVMDGGEIITRSVGIKNKKAILKMLEE